MMQNDVKDPSNIPALATEPVVVKEIDSVAPSIATKNAAVKKTSAKKSVAKKAVAKKAVAKKAVAKKAVAKKAVAKKAPAKKSPAKKAVAKKAPAKKAPAKKDAAIQVDVKKASAKKPAAQKPKVVPVEVAPVQKVKKVKLVRESFTMPGHEYKVLQDIKKAALKAGIELKKSDLLRIGVGMLKNFSVTQLDKARATLTKLRAGRSKK